MVLEILAHPLRHSYASHLPVAVLAKVFRGKFVAGLKRAFQQGRPTFAGTLKPLQHEPAFRCFLRTLFRQSWVVYANHLSADPSMSSVTSPATPIASPSRIIASWLFRTTGLLFGGRITPTATRRR